VDKIFLAHIEILFLRLQDLQRGRVVAEELATLHNSSSGNTLRGEFSVKIYQIIWNVATSLFSVS
jgi:hypothetical protein